MVRKPVPGYPGYEADETGAVFRYGIELSGYTDGQGYRKVVSGRSGYIKRATLGCLAFHGYAPDDGVRRLVAHENDIPGDDRPSNLRWSTYAENAADRKRNGTRYDGEHNPRAKLTADMVKDIRRRYAAGGETQKSLAIEFGVCQRSISLIVRGITWQDT